MAKTVTFTCDWCGAPAVERLRLSRHALFEAVVHDAHDMRELDLCAKCIRDYNDSVVRGLLRRDGGGDEPTA